MSADMIGVLTVRVEIDGAVRDAATLGVRDAHGDVETVYEGDVVVVEAVSARDAGERELSDGRGGNTGTTRRGALETAVAATSSALGSWVRVAEVAVNATLS